MDNQKEEKGFSAFFVTTLYIEGERTVRSRTPGFFLNLEEAEECVLKNYGDIYEVGYYNYAVIEELEEGLYSFVDTSPKWYKVEFLSGKGTGGYKIEKCDPPPTFERVCGFGVG